MLSILLFLAMTSAATDHVSRAIERYRDVQTYQVTLRSKDEVIRYFYKKPGFVRMEFVKPHKGAVLIYDPVKGKVRLRPFGILKPFVLTLDPDSSLIRSPKGHTVDKSDIGELLETAKKLRDRGKAEVLGEEAVGGRSSLRINVEGDNGYAVDGIHSYILWIDKKSWLPVKAASYNAKDKLIEDVLMDDLEINIELPKDIFSL